MFEDSTRKKHDNSSKKENYNYYGYQPMSKQHTPKRILTLMVLVLVAVLLALPSFATTSPVIGINSDVSFVGNFSKFNDIITGDTTHTYVMSDPSGAPLTEDFDNDGTIDIIAFDGTTLRAFDKEATLQATFVVGSLTKPMLASQDLNNDGIREIMLSHDTASSQSILYMFNYNGTHLNSVNNLTFNFLGVATGTEVQYSCSTSGQCIALGANSKSASGSGGSANLVSVIAFNYTTVQSTQTIASYTKSGDYPKYCLSRFRTQPVVDINNDGKDEYVASLVLGKTSGTTLYLYTMSINDTFGVELESTTTNTAIYNTNSGSSVDCRSDNQADTFTSPLVHNIDGVSSNGVEAVLAYMEDDDEYVMRTYEWDGSTYSGGFNHPSVFQADGQLLSNIFLANAQPESDAVVDYCVLGHRFNDNTLNLLCANIVSFGSVQTIEYDFDMSSYYNISTDFDQLAIMAHSIQSDSTLHSGNDMSEILTSIGVFRLTDNNGAELTGNPFDMELIWENPYNNMAFVPTDLDYVGWDDLVGLTPTNLWVFQDGVENGLPDLTGGSINPTPLSTWKVNTSMEWRAQITDNEGDLVSARVIIYEGETNEQDSGWSYNFTSGTTFSFSNWDINETTTSSTMTLYYTDSRHPDQNKSVSYPFSVGINGIEFGDTILTLESEATNDTGLNITGVNQNDNVVRNTLETTNSLFGWGLGTKLLYLIALIFVSGALWWKAASSGSPVVGVGLSAFLFVAGLIVGAGLGLVDAYIIITMVILMLFVIVLAGWKFFSGHSSGGG